MRKSSASHNEFFFKLFHYNLQERVKQVKFYIICEVEL
jgi:hypothetical protein